MTTPTIAEAVESVTARAFGRQPSPDNGIADLRPKRPKFSARDRRYLEAAREILTREFAGPPPLRDLARRVGMNASKLCAGFVWHFGETTSEYVRRQRMQHAHRLLARFDLPVQQVALQVGYRHHSTFTAAFVKHFGGPPRLLRQGRMDTGR